MKKYIETDKAEIILEHILETDTRTFFNREDELTDKVYSSVSNGLKMLKSLPAADVVEIKQGRWIYDEWIGWVCSECGNQAPFWCISAAQNLTDYCPHCGAKMDSNENG